MINEHLKLWETKYPELVKEIRDGLYLDDLMTGGETVAMALENIDASKTADEEDISYVKHQLGFSKPDTKLLGLPWVKSKDKLSVETPGKTTTTTK